MRNHSLKSLFVLVIFAAVIVASESARAEAKTCGVPISDTARVPVATTLTGGVSLGAYQAGSLFYSTQILNSNPELFAPKLFTGASAGALNALLSVLAVCGENPNVTETPDATASAFYRTWVGFRASELLARADGSNGGANSLFSRDGFKTLVGEIESAWMRGLPVSCDVVLGVSVTRLHARDDLSTLGFSRQGEKVAFRIRGRGPGRAPRVTNYVNPALFPKPMLIQLDAENDRQNFEAVKNVLFASSAFPLAFEPQKLSTCVATSAPSWEHAEFPFVCPKNEVQDALFVDGGLLDNRPLALAEKISTAGLTKDACGVTTWREIPGARDDRSIQGSELLYLYSDLAAITPVTAQSENEAGVFNVSQLMLKTFFGTSRAADSSSLLDSSPTLENQIARPENKIPRMGDSLIGFFGLIERDFRAFDFYVGLWETRKFWEAGLRSRLRVGDKFVGDAIRLPKFDPRTEDARKLSCLDEIFDGTRPNACTAVTDRGFVTLARLAGERLKNKRLDFDFMTAKLSEMKYEFRDLGLSSDDAWRAPGKIKTEAIEAVSRIARSQPLAEGLTLRAVGPFALNLIEPLPIEQDFALTIGPQTSVTISTRVSPEGLRWNFGIGLENLAAWLGPQAGAIVPTPFTGFEWENRAWSTRFLQTRLGLGLGYKFAPGVLDQLCESDHQTPSSCRGFAVRPGISFTIVERVRIQTDAEVMPFQKDGSVPWHILPSMGLQFYF